MQADKIYPFLFKGSGSRQAKIKQNYSFLS